MNLKVTVDLSPVLMGVLGKLGLLAGCAEDAPQKAEERATVEEAKEKKPRPQVKKEKAKADKPAPGEGQGRPEEKEEEAKAQADGDEGTASAEAREPEKDGPVSELSNEDLRSLMKTIPEDMGNEARAILLKYVGGTERPKVYDLKPEDRVPFVREAARLCGGELTGITDNIRRVLPWGRMPYCLQARRNGG